MKENKKNIAVIFGGVSSEHEVSIMSVKNVINGINEEKYNIVILGITKEGRWLLVEDRKQIYDDSWYELGKPAVISPDAVDKCILAGTEKIKIDVVFPVLHGKYGEDGTIQGLFEMAQIPYVGCGVLSSSCCMDKFYTKVIVKPLGIRQANFVGVRKYELKHQEEIIEKVEKELKYPVFVKPSCAGSSCGVRKVTKKEELIPALEYASEYDSKILVEEYIKGREIESAVLGGGNFKPIVSGVGEILAAADFYDYDAKYNSPDSMTVINPDLPDYVVDTIRKDAIEIFNAVEGFGLSRVDFFVTDENEVVFNEINTMPGFTAISLYPKLFEAAGKNLSELIEELIELAFQRN